MLRFVNVFLVLGNPKLDAVCWMQSNECRIKGVITSFDLLAVLLTQSVMLLSLFAARHTVGSHSASGPGVLRAHKLVLLQGALPSEVQGLAFVVVKLFKVLYWLIPPACLRVALSSSVSVGPSPATSHSSQFGVMHRLCEQGPLSSTR